MLSTCRNGWQNGGHRLDEYAGSMMKQHRRAPTVFEQRVYDCVRRVPRGTVTTYAWVAKAIGCGSAQAVGQALRRNPYAPEVPCHRVIRSDLTLGGFSGKSKGTAVVRKKQLLREEGVTFHSGRLASLDRLIRPV